MRGATLRDLNIRWHYWFIPTAFGVAAIIALVATRSEPRDRFALLAMALFFGGVSLLAFLWPVLRLRERHGVRFCSLRFAGEPIQGVFIPASSVKGWLLLIGGTVFGVAGLGMAIAADTMEDRVKGSIAFLFYIGFAWLWTRGLLARKPGILLSERGVLWHEVLLAPCFIAWEEIAAAQVYEHRDKYSSVLTFGMRMHQVGCLAVGHRTKAKLIENFNRHGWHFYYHAESLLAPLGNVEASVAHYWKHAKDRGELATGCGMNRIGNGETNLQKHSV